MSGCVLRRGREDSGGSDRGRRRRSGSTLLEAERSAATAGEALSTIGIVLGQLAKSGIPRSLGATEAVDAAIGAGHELWGEMNGQKRRG